ALLLRHYWPGNVGEVHYAAEGFAVGLELVLEGADAEQAPPPGGGLSDQVESFDRALIGAELARPHCSFRCLSEALG
ncbi:Fis family transcriptional regulator, partial [Pseudomonas syringae pv. tagetis]